MNINYRKISPKAKAPMKGTAGAAGFDLTADSLEILLGGVYCYGSGIAMEIPPGHVGLLFPRSSVAGTSLILANCVGVIDSDYRGEIKAKFREVQGLQKRYSVGERFCQLVIMKIPDVSFNEVDSLVESARGEGGFGSSGN